MIADELYNFYRELGYWVNFEGERLMISSKYTLATSDLQAIKPLITSLDKVPILQYAGCSYIFVRDPSRLPDLFPVLGRPAEDWIPLPSGEGAAFDQSYWLSPLGLALNDLPSVVGILLPGVFERIDEMKALPVFDTGDIDGLAKACIGRQLGVAEATLSIGHGKIPDLYASIVANLSPLPEVVEPEPEPEPLLEPEPERRSFFEDAILPDEYRPTIPMESDEIEWARLLDGIAPGSLSPLRLVAIILSIEDIDLPEDPLTSLALLDMAITAMPPTLAHPDELFSYIWPTRQAIRVNLEFHIIASQILAGILLRFSMGRDAGFFMDSSLSLGEVFYKNPETLISDLFGAPEIIAWIERNILTAPAPQLTSRTQKIAEVIKQVGEDIMADVSTPYYRQLIASHHRD